MPASYLFLLKNDYNNDDDDDDDGDDDNDFD